MPRCCTTTRCSNGKPPRRLLILCVIFGLLATPLTTWMLVAIDSTSRVPYTTVDNGNAAALWERHRQPDWPEIATQSEPIRVERTRSGSTTYTYWDGANGEQYLIVHRQQGWPVNALTGVSLLARPNTGLPVAVDSWWQMTISEGWLRRGSTRNIYLALRPTWGFLFNVVFYAGSFFVLTRALCWLKQRRRSSRGRCQACNHALLAAQLTCPECGVARISAERGDCS